MIRADHFDDTPVHRRQSPRTPPLNARAFQMVSCAEGAWAGSQGAAGGRGFRLGARDDRGRPPSVSSSYKQKIDALFDDTRSVASGRARAGRGDSKVSQRSEPAAAEDGRRRDNNCVQERIERMFAELAGEARGGGSAFSGHYLGCTALRAKVTSLSGLQAPLRELYLAHRRAPRARAAPAGRLEICRGGLRLRAAAARADTERLNPFPTIAVWSAVKFVAQRGPGGAACGFLPLITDPDSVDRAALLRPLPPADAPLVLSSNESTHEPIFAVVMRKIGVAKQLECHGFVCQSSEDAIVIAATLYKSLMSHMNRQSNADKKMLKNRNGVSCMSVASSGSPRDGPPRSPPRSPPRAPLRPPRKKHSASSLSGDSDKADGFSASESFSEPPAGRARRMSSADLPPPPPPPAAPPAPLPAPAAPPAPPAELRRITVEEVKAKLDSITHSDAGGAAAATARSVSDKIELFRELERLQRPPSAPPPVPQRPPSEPPPEPREPLRRSHSGRQSLSDAGDILTKVAIPRSGSFLNAGGLARYKSIGHRNNGKKGGGSPLGFNELFNEFKVQENLHSMDDILNAIIDAEGMSFNDLKPIYKEFLLKLAVTLTKDEIFQHSKAIMKKQKKKILRRSSTFQNKRRKIFKGASGLRMVFRLPFGRDVRKKDKKRKHHGSSDTCAAATSKLSDSAASHSSYDLRQFRPRAPAAAAAARRADRASTSEDSDFPTLGRRAAGHNRNSSSGYVSCSECESDGCADRCYCSLRAAARPRRPACKDCAKRETYAGDISYCSCDSESCADSGKCYCPAPARAPRAPAPARSLERPRSPARRLYSERLRRAFDDDYDYSKGRTRSSSSSARRRRRARSSDDLALDYELLLNQPRSDRSLQRLTVRSTGAGSADALSVKKSAEMAALFADVRLSQRTDVRALGRRAPRPAAPPPARPARPAAAPRPLSRGASLEDTLGYLP